MKPNSNICKSQKILFSLCFALLFCLIFSCCFLGFAGSNPTVSALDNDFSGYDILIVAGQSNAFGCGIGDNITETFEHENVSFLNYNTENNQYYVSDDKTRFLWNGLYRTAFSEYFASYYADNCLESGRKLLIVDGSEGGSAFIAGVNADGESDGQWHTGRWCVGDTVETSAPLYKGLIDKINAVKTDPNNRFVGMLWHQGESEMMAYNATLFETGAVVNADFYVEQATKVFNGVQNTVKTSANSFNQNNTMPIFSGEVCRYFGDKYYSGQAAVDNITIGMKRAINSVEHGYFVESYGASGNFYDEATNPGDIFHFSDSGNQILASRYIDAFELYNSRKTSNVTKIGSSAELKAYFQNASATDAVLTKSFSINFTDFIDAGLAMSATKTLDGQSHTITITGNRTGTEYTSDQTLGHVLKENKGTIKNTNFMFSATSTMYSSDSKSMTVGAVVGTNSGTFDNCTLDISSPLMLNWKGSEYLGNRTGHNKLGGFAGTMSAGTIKNSSVLVNNQITSCTGDYGFPAPVRNAFSGGFVGTVSGKSNFSNNSINWNGTHKISAFFGNVTFSTQEGNLYTGGLIGSFEGSGSQSTIDGFIIKGNSLFAGDDSEDYSFSDGEIVGNSENVGTNIYRENAHFDSSNAGAPKAYLFDADTDIYFDKNGRLEVYLGGVDAHSIIYKFNGTIVANQQASQAFPAGTRHFVVDKSNASSNADLTYTTAIKTNLSEHFAKTAHTYGETFDKYSDAGVLGTMQYSSDNTDGNFVIDISGRDNTYTFYNAITGKISWDNSFECNLTKKTITLDWSLDDGQTLTYDGTAKTLSATVGGLGVGDTCSVDCSLTTGNDNVNVGNFTYTATDLDNIYYSLPSTTDSQTYSITPKVLTVQNGEIADKVYDGTTSATLTFAQPSDDIIFGDDVSISGSAEFADSNAGQDKTATATYTLAGEDKDNYALSLATSSLSADITRKPIDKPIATLSFDFAGTSHTAVADGTGFSVTNGSNTNAGNYQATVSLDNNHMWSDNSTSELTFDYSILSVVTFKVGDDVYATQYVKIGETILSPETDPTKDSDIEFDYTFDTWQSDGVALDSTTLASTNETTFVAEFDSATRSYDLTINYLIHGTTTSVNESATVSVEYNEYYNFSAPEINNFTVVGSGIYTIIMDCAGKTYDIYYTAIDNTEYTLTANSGNGSTPVIIAGIGNTIVTAPEDPARTGYTFEHWYAGDDSDTAYVFDRMPAENIEINAKWSINQYTLTVNYYLSGTTDVLATTLSKTLNFNETFTLVAPTVTGHTVVGDSSFDITMADSDQIVNVFYTINQYTVSFNSDGGTSVDSIVQDYDTDVSAPTDPTKTGHTFVHWYAGDDSSVAFTFDKMPASNVQLTAKWNVNQYTISFNSDGGTSVGSIVQDYGTDVSAPTAPTKTGHTFVHWYAGDDSSTAYVFDTISDENVALTAKWSVNEYTLTVNYYLNGTTQSVKDSLCETLEYAEIYTVLAPSIAGYTLKSADQVLVTMADSNQSVNVFYKINQYSITFNSNGGSDIATTTQNFDSALTAPTDPTKIGYIFDHWYTGDDDSVAYTFDKMPACDVELTAKWTIAEYTVTFVSNCDTSIDAITQDYNLDIAAPTVPSKIGHTFEYWYIAGDSETAYVFDKMPARDITLTAKWSANLYDLTIHYYKQGTSEKIQADVIVKVAYGETYTISPSYFLSYKPVDDQDVTVTMNNTAGLETSIYYSELLYKITFDSNGGSAVADINVEFNSSVANPPVPTKAGHSFDYWYFSNPNNEFLFDQIQDDITLTAKWSLNDYDLTVKHYLSGTTEQVRTDKVVSVKFGSTHTETAQAIAGYTVTGDTSKTITMDENGEEIVFYYTVNEVSLSFNSNGGSVVDTIVQDFGSVLTAPTAPTKTGYTFVHWYTSNSNIAFTFDTMPAEDTTLNAEWTVDNHIIIFVGHDGTEIKRRFVNGDNFIPLIDAPEIKSDTHSYTFIGWFDAKTGGTKLAADTLPIGDTTYYAIYAKEAMRCAVNVVNPSNVDVQLVGGGTFDDLTYGSVVSFKINDANNNMLVFVNDQLLVSKNGVYSFKVGSEMSLKIQVGSEIPENDPTIIYIIAGSAGGFVLFLILIFIIIFKKKHNPKKSAAKKLKKMQKEKAKEDKENAVKRAEREKELARKRAETKKANAAKRAELEKELKKQKEHDAKRKEKESATRRSELEKELRRQKAQDAARKEKMQRREKKEELIIEIEEPD